MLKVQIWGVHSATCCQRHPLHIKGAINKETSPLLTKSFRETAKHFAGNTYFIGTFSLLTYFFVFLNTVCTGFAPAPSLFHPFAAEILFNSCALDNSTEPAPQSPPPAATTSHMLPHAGLQMIKRACIHWNQLQCVHLCHKSFKIAPLLWFKMGVP